jgi:hypothetical protein
VGTSWFGRCQQIADIVEIPIATGTPRLNSSFLPQNIFTCREHLYKMWHERFHTVAFSTAEGVKAPRCNMI